MGRRGVLGKGCNWRDPQIYERGALWKRLLSWCQHWHCAEGILERKNKLSTPETYIYKLIKTTNTFKWNFWSNTILFYPSLLVNMVPSVQKVSENLPSSLRYMTSLICCQWDRALFYRLRSNRIKFEPGLQTPCIEAEKLSAEWSFPIQGSQPNSRPFLLLPLDKDLC